MHNAPTSLSIRPATSLDLPVLAAMNKALIEDEGSRNPMTLFELERRMEMWLRGEWNVDLLLDGAETVGYGIYQLQRDEYDGTAVVFVRQYYIVRERRREGLGRALFEMLAQERFPAEGAMVLDVLAHNSGGRAFWDALGFEPYAYTMKRDVITGY
jgi:GNAT superfamily N-acetyltransferase